MLNGNTDIQPILDRKNVNNWTPKEQCVTRSPHFYLVKSQTMSICQRENSFIKNIAFSLFLLFFQWRCLSDNLPLLNRNTLYIPLAWNIIYKTQSFKGNDLVIRLWSVSHHSLLAIQKDQLACSRLTAVKSEVCFMN